MRTKRDGRSRARVVVPTVAAAMLLGALAPLALGGHYHSSGFCNAPNGLVSGGSKYDGATHGRVDDVSSCPDTYKYCAVYSGSTIHAEEASYYATCDAFYDGPGNDCNYGGYVYFEAVFSRHTHSLLPDHPC